MNLKGRCLICNKTDNLNTTMRIKVDKDEYEVDLCDEHADITTPKGARDIIIKKQQEFEELKEKMKQFGIDITGQTGNVLTAKPKTSQPVQDESKNEDINIPHITPKKSAKSDLKTAPKYNLNNVKGDARGMPSLNIDSTVQHIVESAKAKGKIHKDQAVNVPRVEQIELQTVPGPGGVPMTIQKRIKHEDGSSSEITISESSDADLQRRAKRLESMREHSDAHLFVRGYDFTECGLCRGTGKTRANNQICPKCKGKGFV